MTRANHISLLGADSGRRAVAACALVAINACASVTSNADSCTPGDSDGIVGATSTVLMSVSDTAFAVGGIDSGSDQRNITVQNSSAVTLRLANVGSKPHSFVIGCIPTHLPTGCPLQSCFPSAANIPALSPGQSVATSFMTPAVEGAYQFTSDSPGDTQIDANGNLSGLVGEFVLM